MFCYINRKNIYIISLILILFSALLVRLYGVNFGLPFIYISDEKTFVSLALKILRTCDLNPHWFGHPGTTIFYMLALLYIFIFLVGLITGNFINSSDFEQIYYQDPTIFYLSGRLLFVLFAILTIFFVYLIASRLFNKFTGLISASLLAFNSIHVFFSKLIRTDIFMTFLILMVFGFCLKILKNRKVKNYILAGCILGLAVATKYPAVICGVFIIIAWLCTKVWRDIFKVLISGIFCLLGAFVSSPFLFLDFKNMLVDVKGEASCLHISGTGGGCIDNLIWYIKEPLYDSFFLIGLILVVLGVIFCFFYYSKKEKWLLLVFPFCFLFFITSLSLRWAHWIMPIIPFMCIFAGYGLNCIINLFKQRWTFRLNNLLIFFLIFFTLLPLIKTSILQGYEMLRKDTRTLAREWVLENIPKGSRLLIEKYTPHLPTNDYKFFVVNSYEEGYEGSLGELIQLDLSDIKYAVFDPIYTQAGNLKNIQGIYDNKINYIILSNWYERYLKEKDRYKSYSDIVDMYEQLMSIGNKIYEIKPVNKNNGPIIRIYRLKDKE